MHRRDLARLTTAHLVDEAKAFLSGKSQAVRTEMQGAMEAAAERLDFEAAAVYRDRLAALSHIQSHQGINPHSVEEADVFACHQEGGATCIQVFFFRTGQNWGNRAYFPRADRDLDCAAVLGAFLAQFYDDKPVPKLILLSHEIEERDASGGGAVREERHAGQRQRAAARREEGPRRPRARQCARGARPRNSPKSASQKTLLAGLAERFGLPEPPRRIEVYDNSHIMGTNAVGAMIVAGPEGFAKSQYRKFNIRSEDLTPGDDFGMMREVLQRRFSRLLKETGPRERRRERRGKHGAVARPRRHRRRPRPARRGGRASWRNSASPTCR